MAESLMPLAEHFHSIQGEGLYTGTPMHFIRLSGCSVGVAASEASGSGVLPVLENGDDGSFCRTYDGRFFSCDTNWKRVEKVPVSQLLNETYENHICLTGGEPLNHKDKRYFHELFEGARKQDVRIHVETSGTISFAELLEEAWFAVAPKFGYEDDIVAVADEVKLLVDEFFNELKIPRAAIDHNRVYLSPVNFENTVNQRNVAKCMELLKIYPHWNLSCQWHKFLGLR